MNNHNLELKHYEIKECRICYRDYCLISFCQCKGSVKFICYTCFFHHYQYKRKCEICQYNLKLKEFSLTIEDKLLLSVIFIFILSLHLVVLRFFLISCLYLNFLEIIVQHQELYCFLNILFFNTLLVSKF